MGTNSMDLRDDCRLPRAVRVLLSAAVLLIGGSTARQARAGTATAYASAETSFDTVQSETNSGRMGASASQDYPSADHPDPYPTGATASASASVSAQEGSYIQPTLHAMATGQHAYYADHLVDGLASATATWTDNLYYSNPQVETALDQLKLFSPTINFVHQLDGSVSLSTSSFGGTLTASIYSPNLGKSYSAELSLHNAGSINRNLVITMPAEALLYGKGVAPAAYSLALYAQGGTVENLDGSLLGDVTANFSDTASLTTIYVGDASGNPIADPNDDFQVAGDDGAYPMGAPAPEPASLGLLAFGSTGLLGRRRRRA